MCYDFIITETSGIITSPGDETHKMYPTELECFLWFFYVEFDHVVELTFHTIDVEVSEDCNTDYVRVSVFCKHHANMSK